MRPVVLHVFDYSLDGIAAEEDTEFFDYCRSVADDPALDEWIVGSLRQAGVHIVGRVTYEGMARYFPTATGPLAAAMNEIPKVVFSRTLQSTDWAGTTIRAGDLGEEIQAMRQEGSGEIIAHGGVGFAQSLAQLDLVDEYRLTTYPYLAGAGQPLFSAGKARELELVSSTTFANGVTAQSYRRRR